MTDARLVIPALVAAASVGIVIGVPAILNVVAMGAWLCAGVAVAGAILFPRWRTVLAAAAVTSTIAAVLLTSAAFQASARSPQILVDAAHDGRFVTVIAVLDAEVGRGVAPGARSSRTPITITDATVGKTSVHGVSIPALLFGSVPPSAIGARITASGTLASTDAGDRTAFLVFTRGGSRVLATSPWFLKWSNELRSQFRETAGGLPGDGGALLPGLAIGDTSAVSNALDDAMKATSLSHLTAVSGANCAVVVGLIMILGRVLGASRGLRIVLALIVLVGFVILVTPGASVLRAAVMAAIVLASLASGRPSRGLPVLCLAVIVLLTSDPWLSRDYGFILSVLATAGLMVLAGPIAQLFARWIPLPLAILVSVPLAAQLACQPVLILLNPAVPIYGVVANLLAEPAAPIATVLGLLGCLSLSFVPPLGQIAISIAWLPSSWISAIARFFSSAPGAQAPWLPGAIGVIVLAVVTGLVLYSALGRHSLATKIVAGALVVSTVCYGGSLLGSVIGHERAIPSLWSIAACDVGQGDAVLVRSLGQVALVDTGPKPKLLAKCLKELGIDRIQLLILTHYDLDHVGGTSAVFGMVDRALVGPVADATDSKLREALQGAGAAVSEVSRGDHGMLGDVEWQVLWPPTRPGTVEPGNASSVTVRFEGVGACTEGCLSSLFLGDLGEESQSRMLGVAHPQPVDVVKVAHHGSADQSPRLYALVQARVGIIGVGIENRYGHPTNTLLTTLAKVGTKVTRTDLEGMILISSAPGGRVTVWTEHPPDRDVGTH